MKYKRHISILLTFVMLFSIITPVGTIPVSAKEGDSTPLKLEKHTPETNVSMEGVEGELSITFNQPVTILEGKQIQLLYDKEGDGKPNDPVLVQEEPEEGQDPVEPHDGIGGDKGEYTEILTIDKKDPSKVLVDLTYLEKNLLQEDHVYQLNIYEVIKATDHEESFAGLGLTEDQDTWIFDTETNNEITSIEIAGEKKVTQGESTFLIARVKNQHDNALIKEKVTWSSSNQEIATVDKDSGEVTGVVEGKATITAISTNKTDVKETFTIQVEKKEEIVKADVTQPLELEKMTPEHEGSLGGTDGEISLTFNQPVEVFESPDFPMEVMIECDINDNGQFEQTLFTDLNDPDSMLLSGVLQVSDENPNKVIVNVNDLLIEGHDHALWINSVIRVKGSTDTDPASEQVFEGLLNGRDWVFSTASGTVPVVDSIKITGEEVVTVGKSTTLSGEVKDTQGNIMEGETVTWTSSDESKATVDENTGEVNGIAEGTVTITATSTTDNNITANKQILVEAVEKPLELVSLTPEHEGSLGGTDGEISLTFNQPIEVFESPDFPMEVMIECDINDNGQFEQTLFTDPNDPDSMFLNGVLQVSEENPNKVIVNVNELLIKGHDHTMWINSVIRVKDSTETDPSSEQVFEGLLGGRDWIFDTKIQTEEASNIEITGDSAVKVGDKLTLTANVKDANGNIIQDQDVNWSTADVGTATVEKKTLNTSEITGVATGKVIITASLASNFEVKATLEITVGDALDYGLMVKQSMQLSSKRGVEVKGVSMYDGVVHAIVQDNHDTTTKLYAFDLYGHELWKTSLDSGTSAGNWTCVPVYDQDGTIYVQYTKLGGKTIVYAIHQDGAMKWKKNIEQTLVENTEPVIVENQLIITVRDGIYSLDTQSGNISWHKGINGEGLSSNGENHQIETSPVAYGNMIYVTIKGKSLSVEDDKIQAYDVNGNEKWHYIAQNGLLDPLIGYGTVYVVDEKGKIAALAPGDGSTFTSNPLNGYQIEDVRRCVRALIGADNSLYIKYETLKEEGKIIALNSNGTQKYSYTTTSNGIRVVDDAGYLYYTQGNSEGRSTIYAVDPYGKLADSIPGYDSTLAYYNNIKIYGNVLLGSRGIYGQFIVAKIQHDVPETPQSIEFIQPDKTMGVNIQDTLSVVVKNTSGEVMIADELEWSSSDTSVLSVVDGTKGNFKGLKSGTSQVTVKVKDHPEVTKTLTVIVEEKQPVPTTVEILSKDGNVVDNAIEIEFKIPYPFTYRVKDQYGEIMEQETVFWQTSLNLAKVTVDEDGLFHPRATGAFPLAAVSNQDANIRKDITVNIKKEASEFGGILPKEIVLTLPGHVQLNPSNQYDEPFTLEGITWTSADESIAKVDETGVVTATGYGTTTVTATKGSDSFTKEIHVVDAFGYDWNKEYNQVQDDFAEDNEGNIYYNILTAQGKAQLVSTKPDGSENWNVSLDGKYIQHIQWLEDSLYCITNVSGGNRYLTKVNPKTGKEIWNFNIGAQGIDNIQEGPNGNIYVAVNKNFYAVDKTTGDQKWSQAIEGTLYNYALDADGVLYMPVYNSGNTQILKVQDKGDKGTVLESNILEKIQFGVVNSDLLVDQEGTLYSYFDGTIDDIRSTGVCAVKDGNIEWYHFFSSPYTDPSNMRKISLGKDGRIYFSSFYPNTSKQMSKFGVLDKDGNLLWEKELTDLTESGKTMYASGDFEVDDSGNIYIPMMQYASGTTISREKSILVKINSEGTITRYLSYNMDKYGRFDYIHMSDSGIYITGLYEKYVIKLTHENTQAQVADEIHLKAARSSIVKGDYLDITATVYSQVGIAMEDEKVTWTSSKPNIAKVDENGKVTGLAVGTTVITVTSVTNPEVKATYDINVIDAGANYITRDKLEEHIQDILKYYKKIGIDADWAAFAVAALGEDINSTAYATNNKTYMGRLWDLISASESLGAITEYERMSLAILAGGYDPHNFGGMNLIEKIYNFKDLSQGTNAVIWGLIALDAADAKVPESGKYSQEFFVDHLLSNRAGKGWSLSSGGNPDVDITAMAIYSLAPYYNGWEDYRTTEVKTAVDEAVTWLKTKQQEKGGFNYTGANIINTESVAQVIMALTSIGIDPQGDEFARTGGNPVSAMLSNQMADGTFMHEADIKQSDSMATYQALQALAALKRFNEKGYSDIFYHIGAEEPVKVEAWMELITDINKLPEKITLKDEKTIQNLRKRYDALGKDKEKVTNL
ncbi:PQQ-binding-like beta-propeller repeat protein, partial [Alkalibaculum sp. M08DMB]|nr:PQQ-binding-like beta-propeller repeat protein [Alkalibaculum sporogenes]